MNQIFADIEIQNSFNLAKARRSEFSAKQVRAKKIRCLVKPDAHYLFINEEIKRELDLQFVDKRIFETKEKEQVELEMVGPIEVTCLGQRTSTQAVVLPGKKQPVIGSVATFSLHLEIDNTKNQLVVNPKPYRV
jgi:hypothetical protein